jgi:hypothetical protein
MWSGVPSCRDRYTERDPEGKDKATVGAPHVLIVRTPEGG